MKADFYALVVTPPPIVLGMELQPLALGHVILLHAVESAFVTPVDDIEPFRELALAVAICAQPFDDGLRMLHDSATARAMALWARKLTRTRLIDKLLCRKPVAIDIRAEWEVLNGYLRDNTKVPNYAFNPNDSKEIHCPEPQLVKAYLQRAFGFGDKEMMDRPWAQCMWDYVTLRAIDGQIEMVDTKKIQDAMAVGDRIAEALRKRGVSNVNGAS